MKTRHLFGNALLGARLLFVLGSNDWYYTDPRGVRQGPFSREQMKEWTNAGYFGPEIMITRGSSGPPMPASSHQALHDLLANDDARLVIGDMSVPAHGAVVSKQPGNYARAESEPYTQIGQPSFRPPPRQPGGNWEPQPSLDEAYYREGTDGTMSKREKLRNASGTMKKAFKGWLEKKGLSSDPQQQRAGFPPDPRREGGAAAPPPPDRWRDLPSDSDQEGGPGWPRVPPLPPLPRRGPRGEGGEGGGGRGEAVLSKMEALKDSVKSWYNPEARARDDESSDLEGAEDGEWYYEGEGGGAGGEWGYGDGGGGGAGEGEGAEWYYDGRVDGPGPEAGCWDGAGYLDADRGWELGGSWGAPGVGGPAAAAGEEEEPGGGWAGVPPDFDGAPPPPPPGGPGAPPGGRGGEGGGPRFAGAAPGAAPGTLDEGWRRHQEREQAARRAQEEEEEAEGWEELLGEEPPGGGGAAEGGLGEPVFLQDRVPRDEGLRRGYDEGPYYPDDKGFERGLGGQYDDLAPGADDRAWEYEEPPPPPPPAPTPFPPRRPDPTATLFRGLAAEAQAVLSAPSDDEADDLGLRRAAAAAAGPAGGLALRPAGAAAGVAAAAARAPAALLAAFISGAVFNAAPALVAAVALLLAERAETNLRAAVVGTPLLQALVEQEFQTIAIIGSLLFAIPLIAHVILKGWALPAIAAAVAPAARAALLDWAVAVPAPEREFEGGAGAPAQAIDAAGGWWRRDLGVATLALTEQVKVWVSTVGLVLMMVVSALSLARVSWRAAAVNAGIVVLFLGLEAIFLFFIEEPSPSPQVDSAEAEARVLGAAHGLPVPGSSLAAVVQKKVRALLEAAADARELRRPSRRAWRGVLAVGLAGAAVFLTATRLLGAGDAAAAAAAGGPDAAAGGGGAFAAAAAFLQLCLLHGGGALLAAARLPRLRALGVLARPAAVALARPPPLPAGAARGGADGGGPLPEEGAVLEGVSYALDGERAGYALRDVTLRCPAGAVTAVVGPPGPGLAAAADLLCGRAAPDRGSARLQGRPTAQWAPRALRRRCARVGPAAEGGPPPPGLSVREAVGAGLDLRGVGDEALLAAAEAAGGPALAAALAALPGGPGACPAAAAGLAPSQWAALLGRPGPRAVLAAAHHAGGAAPLVLVEEPLLGLPGGGRGAAAEAVLGELRASLGPHQAAVLLSTDPAVGLHADRVYWLEEGAVLEEGAHAELLALGGRYAQAMADQQAAEDFMDNDEGFYYNEVGEEGGASAAAAAAPAGDDAYYYYAGPPAAGGSPSSLGGGGGGGGGTGMTGGSGPWRPPPGQL